MNIKHLLSLATIFWLIPSTCLATDTHSFLYNMFPKFRVQAAALPVVDNFEDKLARDWELEDGTTQKFKEGYLANNFFIGYTGRPTEESYIKIHEHELYQLRLKKEAMGPLSPFYQMYFSRKIDASRATRVLEDFVLAAEEIHHTIQNMELPPSDQVCLLFLGRTPCLIQLALERIQLRNPGDKNPVLIHMNYSGSADSVSKRDRDNYPLEGELVRNMVTPEKRDFYLMYMALKKLQLYKQIIIVDMITTGGGLNGWLRLLRTFMKNRELMMPKLHFMGITQFSHAMYVMGKIHPSQSWTYDAKTRLLTFTPDPKNNIHPFQIPATPIHIGLMTSDVLDDSCLQRYAFHGYYFPAQSWRYDCFKVAERGGEWHEESYEKLRPRIDLTLEFHQKLLRSTELNLKEDGMVTE